MTPDDTARRMQAFAALVEARDGERSVADSRRAVAELFGLSEAEVPRVQREGASAGPLRLTVDPPLTTPVDAPGPERPAAAVGAPVAIRVRPRRRGRGTSARAAWSTSAGAARPTALVYAAPAGGAAAAQRLAKAEGLTVVAHGPGRSYAVPPGARPTRRAAQASA